MKKKALGIIIVSILGAAAIFCSAMFTHQYLDAKSSKATFDDLKNLITEIDEPRKDTEAEKSGLSEEELAACGRRCFTESMEWMTRSLPLRFLRWAMWADNAMEPLPGIIIFFDWDNKGSTGPQDGQADHVGIVQKVENGVVYTIEGDSGDSCRVNQYPVGHYEILGYGVVAY